MSELEFYEKWILGIGFIPENEVEFLTGMLKQRLDSGENFEEVKCRNIHALCLTFLTRVYGIDPSRLIEILEAESASLQTGEEILQEIVEDIDR